MTDDPVWRGSEGAVLTLDSFREHLIRQEETIIFALIERAAFPANPEVYDAKNAVCSVDGRSLLDYMLYETEKVHASVRRFTSPDEAAFFSESLEVKPVLPGLTYPETLKPNTININAKIRTLYLNDLIPKLTAGLGAGASDNRTFGSSSVCDIGCLQALSKRIHYGKYIAEAKFQQETAKYTALIEANDAEGLMALLTNLAVEARVLERVELKASTYGADPQNPTATTPKVDPKLVAQLYAETVMPLTKEVQVQYLLQRLDHPTVAVASAEGAAIAVQHFGVRAEGAVVDVKAPEAVFAKVASSSVAYGVVPLEDVATGINKTTKLLLFSSNLSIIGERVKDNVRYIVLSKVALTRSGGDKTSLAFGLVHEAGALLLALKSFDRHGVNLCTLESLPSETHALTAASAGSYNFFVEFMGHPSDAKVDAVLQELAKVTTFVRVLGSYPCEG
eukprot:TRINITY_DN30453_c0_g1_i1.p1 TRINITY_DN30453_c0_g1~~TRINITY_DN30453_c0_g1_i1.p1  ORF type:complete len:450 (+),score=174.07 TRINITY_DN30453_c0_g1_i1:67-1416(+)